MAVIGADKFREFFNDYADRYIIIGGTACDLVLDAAGFVARATNDIDLILVVEALDAEFVAKFWKFIEAGGYQQNEKSPGKPEFYRFLRPKDPEFPKQIELFSRIPDALTMKGAPHLTPIPADGDLPSLSAILMDDDYYGYALANCTAEEGLQRTNTQALICLKAKAFLDNTERKANGQKIDSGNIKKHKTDVFRLALLLAPDNRFELPAAIKADLQTFADTVKSELPDKAMFKAMGAGNVDANALFNQLCQNFQLNA